MKNIYGLGTDIIEIKRLKKAFKKNKKFKNRIFTYKEIKSCASKKNGYSCFAKRFAAKEAFLKALGIGISKGVNLENIFEICKEFRKSNDYTPIILMGYYNIIFHYGIKRFVNACVKNGVDGLIIVDLQPEEDLSLSKEIKKRNINLIRLITPTTNKERLKIILNNASGFLYYVTITGITGQHSANLKELKKSIKEVKKYTNLPIVSGFGIKNSKQIKEISSFCDGVVIGSSIIKIIEKNYLKNKAKIIPSINNFVKNLKKSTNI